MNKLKTTEKLMRLPERKANEIYEIAYNKMVEAFTLIDYIHQTDHCKILSTLYNIKSKNFTYEGIANLLHMSDNALRRNRETYVKCFIYFLKLIQANAVK